MTAFSTTAGLPDASRKEISASPVPSSAMAVCVSKSGFWRKDAAAALTAFCSAGVYARSACWTRFPSCERTESGMSDGFCVMKKTPTPLERMSRTTCSIFCTRIFGASVKRRCASSKKKIILGFSRSPTSGSVSKSSARATVKTRRTSKVFGTIRRNEARSRFLFRLGPSRSSR